MLLYPVSELGRMVQTKIGETKKTLSGVSRIVCVCVCAQVCNSFVDKFTCHIEPNIFRYMHKISKHPYIDFRILFQQAPENSSLWAGKMAPFSLSFFAHTGAWEEFKIYQFLGSPSSGYLDSLVRGRTQAWVFFKAPRRICGVHIRPQVETLGVLKPGEVVRPLQGGQGQDLVPQLSGLSLPVGRQQGLGMKDTSALEFRAWISLPLGNLTERKSGQTWHLRSSFLFVINKPTGLGVTQAATETLPGLQHYDPVFSVPQKQGPYSSDLVWKPQRSCSFSLFPLRTGSPVQQTWNSYQTRLA